ncbi:MAG: transcription termination/antitermination protein NusG, partial [Sharpea porci]
MFPGYVLVEMVMTDEAWYVVRNTPGVTGFIGSSGGGAKPFPLGKHEIDPILKQMGLATNKVELDFGVGDEVKLLSGPFAGKVGKVDSIDEDKETGVVLVEFLGNLTPVDTDLVAMEKVDL